MNDECYASAEMIKVKNLCAYLSLKNAKLLKNIYLIIRIKNLSTKQLLYKMYSEYDFSK